MAIWSSEIKALEKLYESLKSQLPDLEKELERLVKADDENMILLYSRRCLEVIITDLCESELKRPRKTEPLQGIIDKLHKEEKVPSHIIASMHGLNELSTYGTHPKDFDPEQIKPVLVNLDIIIKWYLKYKETGSDIKVKPTEEIKPEIKSTGDVKKDITISRKRLAGILGGSIGVIASIFAVLYFSNIIGGSKQTKEVEKSIAVLPFRNDSPDSTNKFFIDGTMEAILDNLCKIADLVVVSRTSVEQFRNTTRPIREIAKRLDVNYILEGSGQKYGNDIRLTVQLIDAVNDKHIWSSPYEGVADNIFKLQSQISQAIASELKAIIAPEEKQLIEIIPTKNLIAFNLFSQARSEHMKYWMDNTNIGSLNKAMAFYRQALQYDFTYPQAYSGLAWGYLNKYSGQADLSKNYPDSILFFTDKALSFNDQLDEAFYVKGNYYDITGNYDRALREYSEAIKLNPNNSWAYRSRAGFHFLKDFDIPSGFEDCFKAIKLEHGPLRPGIMRGTGGTIRNMGFPEIARYYFEEALKLDNDSISYLNSLASLEEYQNDSRAVEISDKVLKKDPSNLNALWRNLYCYERLRKYEDAYRTALNILQIWEEKGMSPQYDWDYIGYAFGKSGHLKEAIILINRLIWVKKY